MKLKYLICMAVAVIMSLGSCAQKKGTEMAQQTDNVAAGKSLVAYFSATGTTRNVARRLAEVTGADLFEIKPEQEYSAADLDWTDSTSRSSVEMHNTDFRPPMAGNVDNIADYDTVYVGFPIWWYIAPTIVNTFVESNDLAGKTIVCFATSGGSPIEPCVDSLRKQYPTLNWADGKLLNNASREELQDWTSSI